MTLLGARLRFSLVESGAFELYSLRLISPCEIAYSLDLLEISRSAT